VASEEEKLRAEVHAVHQVLRLLCQLIGANALTREQLSHALGLLIDHSDLQVETDDPTRKTLTVEELPYYEVHLKAFQDIVDRR